MIVFLVLAIDGRDITNSVSSAFKEKNTRQIGDGSRWLVCDPEVTTSSGIWNRVNSPKGLIGAALAQSSKETPFTDCLIVPVVNYYGFADAGIWQWIESKKKV
ncbi:MAG: hypothetical protein OXC19_19945 [Bryobacterales bacterium]|nr:hypothetical protein [Bryobacterales bacterium]